MNVCVYQWAAIEVWVGILKWEILGSQILQTLSSSINSHKTTGNCTVIESK